MVICHSLRSVVACFLFSASAILADLPIHCLRSNVEGTWKFSLGPASGTRSSCRHVHPDDPMNEPLVGQHQWSSFGSTLTVELRSRGLAAIAGSDASWTMVSDEAMEVRGEDHEFLALFNFDPLPADADGEHLPLILQQAHSRCNETLLGWYRDTARKSWGCWAGRRVDNSVGLFLQQRNAQKQRHSRRHGLKQRLAFRHKARSGRSFDWRNASGVNWVDPPVQQGMCGGCYAIASVQSLSSRNRIARQDASLEGLSVAFPLFCGEYTQGCQGGYPYLTAKWSEDVGLVPESCLPFTEDGTCRMQCHISELAREQQVRASNHRYITGGEEDILEELRNGPVAVSFRSDPSLQEYTGGVWDPPPLEEDPQSDNRGFIVPTHSCLLVGYGEDSAVGPYWVLQNAWGSGWGEHGSFRIRRDVARERGLEVLVVAADVVPDDKPEILQDFVAHATSSESLALLSLNRKSHRATTKGHRGEPLCRAPASSSGGTSILVRLDRESNFRGMSFGDSAGTETAVQCAGPAPDSCSTSPSADTAPDCTSLDGCACDLHGQDLLYPGMQALAEKVALMCTSSEQPVQALMIGLGGGAISSFLQDRCGTGKLILDNIEYDARVADLASKFFGFHAGDNNKLEITDGLSAVKERPAGTYDAVLVDCFAGQDRVPMGCRSEEFLAAAKALLKSDGIILQNIWGRSSASPLAAVEFNETMVAYSSVFKQAPGREVAFECPESLEYILYGIQGERWTSLIPPDTD